MRHLDNSIRYKQITKYITVTQRHLCTFHDANKTTRSSNYCFNRSFILYRYHIYVLTFLLNGNAQLRPKTCGNSFRYNFLRRIGPQTFLNIINTVQSRECSIFELFESLRRISRFFHCIVENLTITILVFSHYI